VYLTPGFTRLLYNIQPGKGVGLLAETLVITYLHTGYIQSSAREVDSLIHIIIIIIIIYPLLDTSPTANLKRIIHVKNFKTHTHTHKTRQPLIGSS